MQIIVRHRSESKLAAGICIKQEIIQAESPASALDPRGTKSMIPICLCFVVWDQQIVSDKGEVSYPKDEERLPAVCLHYANELIFEGPYIPETSLEGDDDYKMVGEFLEENQPEVYDQILKAILGEEDEVENVQQEETQI